MLKYLIILLDNTSVSFCHYDNSEVKGNRMPLKTLHAAILFAMKHNLHIQYVLPPYKLPADYIDIINSYPHDSIAPIKQQDLASVVVSDGIANLCENISNLSPSKRYVLRTTVKEFLETGDLLVSVFSLGISLNVVITDVEVFSDIDIQRYQQILQRLSSHIASLVVEGININSNILTDRIVLQEMNNCGAGETSLTLAPDGKLYPCPGFYYSNELNSYSTSLDSPVFPNNRLFTLQYAPLCKRCDSYHCKRCVWLNKRLTFEVNIPSHQQCVMSHIERNESKELLGKFHRQGILKDLTIPSIDYLDPFDKYSAL